jgi:pimeloyl-ACP methyl ester carboxylesterase
VARDNNVYSAAILIYRKKDLSQKDLSQKTSNRSRGGYGCMEKEISTRDNLVTMPPPRPTRQRLTFATFPWIFFRRALLIFAVCAAGVVLYTWLRPVEVLLDVTAVNLRLEGIHSRSVTIDGHRIHYYTGGSGTPIVLVHGLGGRSEDWANLMPQLMRDHRQVYALDLLGFGQSDKPRDVAYSIPQEAHLVEQFMDAQHLSNPDLAGWSMGGWVALRVALDQPQRIQRLLIYDSAGVRFDLTFDPGLFAPDSPQKLAQLNQILNPGPTPPIPGFIGRDVLRITRNNGWVVLRAMDSMLTQKDLLDGQLAALKMPMLIAWGKLDHVIPAEAGAAIHKEVPQSVLEIFDGCGHLAPRQCADRVGPQTVEFLDANPPLESQRKEIAARR